MSKVSLIYTIKNRANLFKYALESITRQDYNLKDLEVCLSDAGSTDNLLSLIDRYSEVLTFKYGHTDKKKSYVPMLAYNPSADYNLLAKYVASHNYVIKVDPEIVMKDPWVISEIVENLEKDDTRMYNARCHFTQGDGWYVDYDDIIRDHEKHYHFAEGGPFTRSKFYFCSGWSKERFIEMGGVDEMFCNGVGYDDTCFREHWKNYYGQYEKEITGQVIHLWHGTNKYNPSYEHLNRRLFESLKGMPKANLVRLKHEQSVVNPKEPHPWANPEMLSKFYVIKNGEIIDVEQYHENAKELDLPF